MSARVEIQKCPVCLQPCLMNPGPCSDACLLIGDAVLELGQRIKSHQPDEDRRIFFHDLSFGELADLYTIALVRRAHQTSLRDQQESDLLMRRLERSLMTKYNRTALTTAQRDRISSSIKELAKTNALLWRLRSRANDRRLPDSERSAAAVEYLAASDDRYSVKRDLDSEVDGRTLLPWDRVYR